MSLDSPREGSQTVTVRFAENHFAVIHFALVHFAVGAFRRQFISPLIAINLTAIRDILVK